MLCAGRWCRLIVLPLGRSLHKGCSGLLSRLAIPFSLITLIVIGVLRVDPGNSAEIDAYHERVAQVINAMPVDFHGWVGQQVPLPQSAVKLLDPNALVARQYFNADRGIAATLLIVQCRDTRDMAGHYPPQCYPASGWMESQENPAQMYSLGDYTLRKYSYHRIAGQSERDIHVYSLFALPTGELTTSMREVRRLGADYDYRKYGAAQLQVVIGGDVDPEDHAWILDEMFRIARPSIEAVLDARPGHARNERGAP